MGIVVYLAGQLECVRCGQVAEESMSTYLLQRRRDNASHVYREGDTVVVDGLDEYLALERWNGDELVVAVGDWACSACELNWQWARAVLTVTGPEGALGATIRSISTLTPFESAALDGVHFIEPALAELSGVWGEPAAYDAAQGVAYWLDLSSDERKARVADGYRAWCRDTARLTAR